MEALGKLSVLNGLPILVPVVLLAGSFMNRSTLNGLWKHDGKCHFQQSLMGSY